MSSVYGHRGLMMTLKRGQVFPSTQLRCHVVGKLRVVAELNNDTRGYKSIVSHASRTTSVHRNRSIIDEDAMPSVWYGVSTHTTIGITSTDGEEYNTGISRPRGVDHGMLPSCRVSNMFRLALLFRELIIMRVVASHLADFEQRVSTSAPALSEYLSHAIEFHMPAFRAAYMELLRFVLRLNSRCFRCFRA
jgi:hypothetical protein